MNNKEIIIVVIAFCITIYLLIKRPPFWDKNDVHKIASKLYITVSAIWIVVLINIFTKACS